MFKLPELKYSYDALEPYIDRNTMEIHHSKHHAGYVKKFNLALKNFDVGKNTTIESIIRSLNDDVPTDLYWDIKNNGGGALNHNLFFEMMSPNGGGEPKGELAEKIKEVYTSFDNFKSKFKKSALSRFGSGWAWLLLNEEGRMYIKSSANQDNPMIHGNKVLLCIDVWEHAYYLNYQNKRGEYVDKWWNVVDWDYVEERYNKLKNVK